MILYNWKVGDRVAVVKATYSNHNEIGWTGTVAVVENPIGVLVTVDNKDSEVYFLYRSTDLIPESVYKSKIYQVIK